MKYQIVYDSPGRLRVRCGRDVFSKYQEQSLEEMLADLPGVASARASSVNGSILVTYKDIEKERILKEITSVCAEDIAVLPLAPVREADEVFKRKCAKIILKSLAMKFLAPSFVSVPLTILRALPFVRAGAKSLASGRLNVSVLDAVSISASLISGAYGTASSVMTLLDISSLLEGYTRKKAETALSESLSLNIDKVWRLDGGEPVLTPFAEITPGDVLRVQQGSMIPADGIVFAGEAGVNESAMTGESMPCMKKKASSVYAGTVIEEGSLDIEVTKLPDESRINKVVELIENSETLKAGLQTRAESFADRLVPLSLLTCAATFLLTRNITKAMSVLMVDYSCAIKLSTPICVISAMREAAAYNIMIKGGRFLENFAHADTIMFDKTGTLTVSCPNLAKVVAFGKSEDEVLKIAACLEEHFPHSVAKAIVRAAEERDLKHEEEHAEVEYIVAHGISSRLHGEKALIGSAHFIFDDEKIGVSAEQKQIIDGLGVKYSMVYLAIGSKLCGILCIEDPIRKDADRTIAALKQRGFSHIIMVTGDGEATAKNVCAELGIEKYYARVLPEDKLKIVQRQKDLGHKVVMVGDGINDSPALAAADVSVAMKDSSDIAREVADITLLSSDLGRLVLLRDLSGKLFLRIRRNYRFISVFNTALILLGIGGIMPPVVSAILHNLSTIGVCAGSMKPFLPAGKDLYIENYCFR